MLFDVPQPEPAPANPTPEIASKPFKHSVVDSKKGVNETLASYIGGSNFWCNYYSQVFTDSEELKPFDPSQLSVYQQYHKINDFIIKLQGALSGSDDSSGTGRFNLTGTAIIPPLPNLIPNVGDALIADIGEGNAGQFTVTSIRKLSHNLAAAWEIEFSLERIADQHITGLMDAKVTKESYYQKDYLISGQNALLTTEDYKASNDLHAWFKNIAKLMVNNNFSHETRTITIPLQNEISYDASVTKALNRLVTESDVPQWRYVTLFNVDDYRVEKQPSIYDAIINRDASLFYVIPQDFKTIYTGNMSTLAYQNPIRLSGVKRIVIPYSDRLDNDNYTGLHKLLANNVNPLHPGLDVNGSGGTGSVNGLDNCGCSNKYNPYWIAKQEENEQSNVGVVGMQIPTITNGSYVLSKAFYKRELTQCTQFERDLWDILDSKPISRTNIYAYCENYQKWGRLEQYYLGPFLLMMIRCAILGI